MNRRFALALAAAALLAACGQSPTAAPARSPVIRHDGGNGLGSGNFTGGAGTGATTTDGGSTLDPGHAGGGNGLGSGN